MWLVSLRPIWGAWCGEISMSFIFRSVFYVITLSLYLLHWCLRSNLHICVRLAYRCVPIDSRHGAITCTLSAFSFRTVLYPPSPISLTYVETLLNPLIDLSNVVCHPQTLTQHPLHLSILITPIHLAYYTGIQLYPLFSFAYARLWPLWYVVLMSSLIHLIFNRLAYPHSWFTMSTSLRFH